MLLVKTYIDKSPIDGFGLFAAEAIKEGTRLWEWNWDFDRVVPLPVYKNVPANSFIRKYGYMRKGSWYLCYDDARFMNHSNKPNIVCLDGYDLAIRNIRKDEEITCDYSQFCDDFEGF